MVFLGAEMKNSIMPQVHHQEPTHTRDQATPLCKISLSFAALAVIVHTVGMACPYWLVGAMYFPPYGLNRINVGVFQGCSDFSGCASKGEVMEWQKAAAAVEVMAEVIGVTNVLMLFGALFFTKTDLTWRNVKIVYSVGAILAVVFIVTSLTLYGINANLLIVGVMFSIGWAYVLACIAAILLLLAGVIMIIDMVL